MPKKQFKMKTHSLSLKVSDAIGKVSAEYIIPEESRCIMTLAHGAGAGMHHSFMATLANSLAEASIATLRFNFPFAENYLTLSIGSPISTHERRTSRPAVMTVFASTIRSPKRVI